MNDSLLNTLQLKTDKIRTFQGSAFYCLLKKLYFSILIVSAVFLNSCDSKQKYTTKIDKQIITYLQKGNAEKLAELFSDQVEFEYGVEGFMIYQKSSDEKEFLTNKDSQFHSFLFKLDEKIAGSTSWLCLKDAVTNAYKIEAENVEVLDDRSYIRSIHIYNDKSYNRINLKCKDEENCRIIYFNMGSSRI
ncbi:MAG TPA: hypothetical protein PLJ29_12145 [Leptospiraceae bacterium]|nr:hypothetical protein [Leptospiraceae bacterium]HMY66312.1 hypothetical protein [Leptospiraceae bacterium]HNI27105.1 hypothetical protein [Leptospiraceae bacterium]HNM02211.1 hypothetical protein [Leptospiraceae bacterium]